MNIRAEIFAGPDERKARLLVRKKPKQAETSALTAIVVPREEPRRVDMRHEDRPAPELQQLQVLFRERLHDVDVVNLSGGGAMIAAKLDANIGERIDLQITKADTIECLVRWVKGGRLGVEFAHETKLECREEKRDAVLRGVVSRLPQEIQMVPVPPQPPENRRADRHPLIWSGELRHGTHRCSVRLRNISTTGALVQCSRPLRTGADVLLDLGEAGEVPARISWVVGDHAGLHFAGPFDLEQLANCKPSVTAAAWLRPTYLETEASTDSAWDAPWNTMTLGELRTQLEGFLKR